MCVGTREAGSFCLCYLLPYQLRGVLAADQLQTLDVGGGCSSGGRAVICQSEGLGFKPASPGQSVHGEDTKPYVYCV